MNLSKDKDWLEEQIGANIIKSFNYAEFSEIKQVGEGGFGCVNKAYWKSRRITVALKTLKIESIHEFVRELKLLKNVYYHPHINQFLGITRDARSNYVMVLQFADGGNLREYLKNPLSPLTWPDKYRIALEIAEGLLCLHAEGILHRDLHPKNILVHQGKMLIADFGLSKEESLTTSNSIVDGMPAYIDPQYHIRDKYKRDKKSDIFSFGMILWEISSEKAPFAGYKDSQVVFKISNGVREERVDGTPESYFKLYTECWDSDPEKRPNIEEIVETLDNYKPPQPCISYETLTIGSIPVSPTPLCYYSLSKKIFTYQSENTQFKMEFSLYNVFSVEYRPIDDVHSQIVIEVKDPLFFLMHTRHVLKGRANLMRPQLIKLTQEDQSFANVVTIMDTPAPADQLSQKIIIMLFYELILQLIVICFRSFSRILREILRFNNFYKKLLRNSAPQ